jgi:hypothetical protein
MYIGLMAHERFWSIESWKRHRLFRTYHYGGFSIGPILIDFF